MKQKKLYTSLDFPLNREYQIFWNRWDLVMYLIFAFIFLIWAVFNPELFGGKIVILFLIIVIVIGIIVLKKSYKKPRGL